ncbi:hypothetical protein U1Q18_001841, partial [Sarracenia purpurea var. burkii]
YMTWAKEHLIGTLASRLVMKGSATVVPDLRGWRVGMRGGARGRGRGRATAAYAWVTAQGAVGQIVGPLIRSQVGGAQPGVPPAATGITDLPDMPEIVSVFKNDLLRLFGSQSRQPLSFHIHSIAPSLLVRFTLFLYCLVHYFCCFRMFILPYYAGISKITGDNPS